MTRDGRFVVFEGIDGCGKSTQVARVATALGAVATKEPGGTELGAALRSVLLHGSVGMEPLAETLVLVADRAQHLAEVVEPALRAGRDVVCDRYVGSTLAYQGYGPGVDLAILSVVLDTATSGRRADLTLLLDCPVELGRSRRDGRASDEDRFEGAEEGFLERVRAGYLELAASEPGWVVVDAAASLDAVNDAVDAALGAFGILVPPTPGAR